MPTGLWWVLGAAVCFVDVTSIGGAVCGDKAEDMASRGIGLAVLGISLYALALAVRMWEYLDMNAVVEAGI